jgi:hypothetical protein
MMKRNFLTGSALLSLTCATMHARVGAYGNQPQVNVQNRTTRQSVNQNVNVNRNTNVNRNVNVNNNVNVNRNVDVHGGYYGGVVVHDNDWNWGSFAAGAAAGVVTGAVVGAATAPHTTTVVTTPAPAIGTVVTGLPGQCAAVSGAAETFYNCNNIFYRPFYQGTSLVYQVVKYP